MEVKRGLSYSGNNSQISNSGVGDNSGDNKFKRLTNKTKIYLVGGLIFILVGVLLFFLFYSSEEDFLDDDSYDFSDDYEGDYSGDFSESLVEGCESLGLIYNNQQAYSCFDEENDLVKIYLSRSSKNVLLDHIEFYLFGNGTYVNFSSSYGLAPGGSYIYQIDFNRSDLDRVEVLPVIMMDGGEIECSKLYINSISSCQSEDFSLVDSEPDYVLDDDLNVVFLNETNGSSVFLNESQETLSIFSSKPQKKILNFSVDSIFAEIDEVRHRIFLKFSDNRSLNFLTPTIGISENATIVPLSGVGMDFRNPVTYIVKASDNSTQQYTVYASYYLEEVSPNYPVSSFLSVELFPIESSNSSFRQVKYFIQGDKNASSCSLYSGNSVLNSSTNVSTNSNNSFTVSNLLVGRHLFSVVCLDEDSFEAKSNSISFNVSSFRNVVTQLGGTIAGFWSTNLSAAKQMASINKNFYIINYGNQNTCTVCKSMQENVFGTPEFISWANQNGIAMVYANSNYAELEPTKTVLSRYVYPSGQTSVNIPYIVLVGYENDNALASFTYWAGLNINGIVASRTPGNFMSIVRSYTGNYSSIVYPSSLAELTIPIEEVDDCADGSCSVGLDGSGIPNASATNLSSVVSVSLGDGVILTNEYQTFNLPTSVENPLTLSISAIRLTATSSTCTVYQRRVYSDGTITASKSFSVGSSGGVYTDGLENNKILLAVQIRTSTFCNSNMVKVNNITVTRFLDSTQIGSPANTSSVGNIDWTLPAGTGSFSDAISTSGSVAGTWTLDLNAARELAKQNGKFYILNIGATSGCSWCNSLKSGVYNTYSFHEWAKKNGIPLVYADYYPCRSSSGGYNTQSASCPAVVREVRGLYQYSEFPTVYIISGSGTGKTVIGSFVARKGYNTLNAYINAVKSRVE